jgi:hypothetical protein
MWAVFRKRIGKYVATESLILENQLVTEHGFRDNAFMKSSIGTLGGGDLYSVLSQL